MRAQGTPAARRGWGIAHLLVVLVLAALTPAILLEFYRGAQDVDDRREAIFERAGTRAVQAAESLDEFLRFTELYLATLAVVPTTQVLDPGWTTELFLNVQALNPNYLNVFLVDLDGRQVVSTTPSIADPQITSKGYFRRAIATRRLAFSEVIVLPGDERSVVVLAYPVARTDATPVGVLCVALDVARLGDLIGPVGLSPGSVVLLAQEDGEVIAASRDPQLWLSRPLADTTTFGQLRQAGGVATSDMADGSERVVGYAPLANAPWLVAAAIPQGEVGVAIRRSLTDIALQVALAALATALITWLVLGRIVRPIRLLADGARAFATGDLSRRIPLRRRDELGDLATALNTMAASLAQRLDEQAAHTRALDELNQLQREFVATASHELRTPVTAIRSYAEALRREEILDEETRRECIEGIDRISERLARLVRTLLDVSRIESGALHVALGPVDTAASARAAVAQAGLEHAARDFVLDAPLDLPPVEADAERLEDVLANLLANAAKFSPPDESVLLRMRRAGGLVAFEIVDHGPGIAEDELGRIFDRFYQIGRGTTREAGGAGLGLYIAHGYVTAMHGRIEVRSSPGRGSTFTVLLPVALSASTPEERERDAPVAGAARR